MLSFFLLCIFGFRWLYGHSYSGYKLEICLVRYKRNELTYTSMPYPQGVHTSCHTAVVYTTLSVPVLLLDILAPTRRLGEKSGYRRSEINIEMYFKEEIKCALVCGDVR
jgi:hypothetical protein